MFISTVITKLPFAILLYCKTVTNIEFNKVSRMIIKFKYTKTPIKKTYEKYIFTFYIFMINCSIPREVVKNY